MLDSLRSLATVVTSALPCAADLGSLSAPEEAEAARVLGGIRSAVGSSIALLAADIDRKSARELGTDGLAQKNGFTDGAGFLQDLVGIERGEAARLIRVGGMLETAAEAEPDASLGADDAPDAPPEPPQTIEYLAAVAGAWDAPIAVALKHGWLTASQADGLRQGLRVPRPGFEPAWRGATLDLIRDCWTGRWSPEGLARAAKRMRASLDTHTAAQEAQQRYAQRSFRRFIRHSGMVHYDIDLDPESDARFYGPVKQLLSPRFGGPRFTAEDDIAAAKTLEDDPRSNEQLAADTVIDLIQRAVTTDTGDLFKTHEPHVTIAVTTTELRKARAAQDVLSKHHAGDHTSCPGPAFGLTCDGPDQGIAFLDGRDEAITATDALRMICDRGYTPLFFDETGQTIDLGKDQRYFTRTQRRAITKRDGGCMYPGCDRPPEDSEYHHINPWALHPSHRKSEVRDGILLCRRHHKLIHDFVAHVERQRGDYWLHWPGKPPQQLHTKSGVQALIRAERART
ncbi:HNH endonuclease signature motif containing protein [Gryllotalpicola protaetiae]|uniref:HNH endonuclease signature motif containing protein n=1 Tax=Gryllotalpicola protaetiae TaxID=2419771 RepID=UPI0013C4C304|nr:HNH endonuclease signature motif containing protein [Gryllotalpicola protaetiae]